MKLTDQNRQPELLGVLGKRGSGKDTVSQILEKKGYTHFSLSSIVHAAIDEWHLGEHDRDALKLAGTRLRELHGEDYVVDTALETLERPLVLSGIYSPREVERIHQAGGLVVAVVADDDVRRSRIMSRARTKNELDPAAFSAAERVDDSGGHLQLDEAIKAADYTLHNGADSSLRGLEAVVDQLLMEMQQ